MSFKQIRKPIAGITLAATSFFGISCSNNATPEVIKSNETIVENFSSAAISNFEECVTKHSQENYRYNNTLSSFGQEMAGQITVAACAAMQSCPEDSTPEQLLNYVVKNKAEYAEEAANVLKDPSNDGLVELDELRDCQEVRIYKSDGSEEVKIIGEEPMWFINRYPS